MAHHKKLSYFSIHNSLVTFYDQRFKKKQTKLIICFCMFAYRTTMDLISKYDDQNSADGEDSEQILWTKLKMNN